MKHSARYSLYAFAACAVVAFVCLTAAIVARRKKGAVAALMVLAIASLVCGIAFLVMYASRKKTTQKETRSSAAKSTFAVQASRVHPVIASAPQPQRFMPPPPQPRPLLLTETPTATAARVKLGSVRQSDTSVIHELRKRHRRSHHEMVKPRVTFRPHSEERHYITDDPPPVMSPSYVAATYDATSSPSPYPPSSPSPSPSPSSPSLLLPSLPPPSPSPPSPSPPSPSFASAPSTSSVPSSSPSSVALSSPHVTIRADSLRESLVGSGNLTNLSSPLLPESDVREYMSSLYNHQQDTQPSSGGDVEASHPIETIPIDGDDVYDGSQPDDDNNKGTASEIDQFIVQRPRNAAEITEARERHLRYRFNPENLYKALAHDRVYGIGEGKSAKDGIKQDNTYKALRITREQYETFLKTRNREASAFQDASINIST